jgi:hypothetical protein
MLTGESNPGPLAEIEFWSGKSKNLNLVHDQLNGEKVRRVMKVLEITKSTYFPAFNRLCKEVAQARMEVYSDLAHTVLIIVIQFSLKLISGIFLNSQTTTCCTLNRSNRWLDS